MYIHFDHKEKFANQISSTEFKLENGINIKINEENLNAGIVLSTKTEVDIYIPRFFERQSKKYLITYIDSRAFYLNKDIKSLRFSEDSGILGIGDSAFSESTIEKLLIPANLRELGKRWCSFSNNLFHIEVSPRNQHFILKEKFLIGKSSTNGIFDTLLFSCRDIGSDIEILSEIQYIAPYAFDSCKNIKNISFHICSKLKIIDDHAFYKCSNLENISAIPCSVVKIGFQSFMFSSKLKSIEFLSDEIYLCEYSFSYCSCLVLASFPSAKKVSINIKAFYKCQKDFSIMINSNAEINSKG
ncbi:hypothetical protein M9Y10_001026 [Tritrichomonas musculus]|uniref:Surface antigen BspA-like n=1 Tax=Tritrichomonas musculus TaxID=1915356 RepID=A0ABR2L5V3_9EUKA